MGRTLRTGALAMTPAVSFPLPERQRVSAHHDGALATDLPVAEGTPWLAVFDGTTRAYDSGTAGHALYLRSADGSVTAYYGHGADPDTRVIGQVKAGQVIGNVGMTGRTTGPHLHFAVTTSGIVNYQGGGDVDPAAFLEGAPSSPVAPPAPSYGEAPSPVAPPAPSYGEAPPTAGMWSGFVNFLPESAQPFAAVGAAIVGGLVLFALLED
jgi:murein DD-endopeptidase MepM/ murein hydrolase activator NlpD